MLMSSTPLAGWLFLGRGLGSSNLPSNILDTLFFILAADAGGLVRARGENRGNTSFESRLGAMRVWSLPPISCFIFEMASPFCARCSFILVFTTM